MMTLNDSSGNALTAPDRVVIAGDWHHNVKWALSIIRHLPQRLPEESPPILIQLGDLGVWEPPTEGYLSQLHQELSQQEALLLFIDGNHENHSLLGSYSQEEPTWMTETICYLPRGYRWVWHDKTWLALGGAVSVDRSQRRAGFDWFPEEAISPEQEDHFLSYKPHADVMITHDCPSSVFLDLGRVPSFWDIADIARSDAHRERLQRIVDIIQPQHLIHGHYHRAYSKPVEMVHGVVQVSGLDMDGSDYNSFVFNIKTLEWESPS